MLEKKIKSVRGLLEFSRKPNDLLYIYLIIILIIILGTLLSYSDDLISILF
jgi:hypothetical protein